MANCRRGGWSDDRAARLIDWIATLPSQPNLTGLGTLAT
jgi:hypothetical protein